MIGEVIPSKTKNNFAASSAPTVNDDKSEGYVAGSIIYIPSTGATYLCVSNAEGAAVWRLLSGEQYLGVWNASTNSPTLADGTGVASTYYIVSVAGTQNLGSGSQTFTAGDKVIYNGTIWQKQEGGVSYVPEDVANKENTTLDTSTSKYPTNRLVKEVVDAKQATLTESNFGTFSNSLTEKTTPIDADSLNIVDSADSNKSKKVTWANIKATLKTYFDGLYLSLTGGVLTGTLRYLQPVNAQTGTSYVLQASDYAKLITINNASAVTITLPQQSTTPTTDGFWCEVINLGAGPITYSGQGAETIDGNTLQNQYARVKIGRPTTTKWSIAYATAVVNMTALASMSKNLTTSQTKKYFKPQAAATFLGIQFDCFSLVTAGTFKLQLNGVDITGLTGLIPTTTVSTAFCSSAVSLAPNDVITAVADGTLDTVVDLDITPIFTINL